MSRKKEKEQENKEPIVQVDAAAQNGNLEGTKEIEEMSNGQPITDENLDGGTIKTEVQKDPTILLENQVNEYKDKYLRLSAEFDNYRKRTQREKMDLIKYGSEDVLKAIIPVVDDFERAIKSVEKSTDIEAVKQGLYLIYSKFSEFLKTNGIQEIAAIGQQLDTDVHEAITKTPVQDESLKGKIVDVIEKGYKLSDRVIRFSKVVIGE